MPSGLPAELPGAAAAPWPALDPGALVILWSGGLWDWMDPLTLIRAMPAVLAAQPQARLIFLAGRHPGDVPPMQMPERARALAAELGLLGRAVLFVDQWVPYAERAGALFGMPTRTEVDAAHRRIAELERALRRMRDAAPEPKREAPGRASPPPRPAPKKPAARKATAKKTAVRESAANAVKPARRNAFADIAPPSVAKKAAKRGGKR